MAQPLRSNPRQTRSSAACDSCRSKKQKCGGEWPTCARCRETGMDCTWPPQLQRGPAKGYLEAIETRLDDVEHILLQVLPLVPKEQLNSITCPGQGGRVVEAAQKRTTQEKRAALDYWSIYPLNSPQALLVWCQDQQKRHGSRPPNEDVGEPRTASTRECHSSGHVTVPGHLTAPSPSNMNHLHQRPSAGATNDTVWESSPMSFSRSGPSVTGSMTPGPSAPPYDITSLDVQYTAKSHSSTAISDYGQVDLSDEFQQKFVW